MTDPLNFDCPTCHTKLTVPASMAGVSGPCPSCGAPIQAPSIPPIPAPAPLPDRPFRVEPRQARTRTPDSPEVVSRPMPEIDPDYVPSRGTLPSRPKDPKRIFRIILSLLVIAIMIGVTFGLREYLIGDGHKGNPGGRNTVKKIFPDDDYPAPDATPPSKPTTALPPRSAEPPAAGSAAAAAAAASADETETAKPGNSSLKVLEQFLTATNLAARLPLIETKLSRDELAASVLAKPLPPTMQVQPEIQEAGPTGNYIDLFYSVDFALENGKVNRAVILTRSYKTGDVKIIVDPFLDSFGGRLAAFASDPSDKPATFQVLVTAVARCYDKSVPNREQKLTLKLLSRDNEKEIANAYFTKASKLSQMLQDDTSGFRYGQARPAVVTLQWNTKENPGMPYLEAVGLNDFRWNP